MPSPELETPGHRLEMPSRELEAVGTSIPIAPPTLGETNLLDLEERASTDIEDSEDESENEDQRPVTKHDRARSLDSARSRLKNKKLIYLKSKTLSTEQEKAIQNTTSLSTQEQQAQTQRRQDRIAPQNTSGDPETSRHKGKTIDPREWGNAGISPGELDISHQRAMLEAYERGQKEAKRGLKRSKNRNKKISAYQLLLSKKV